MRSQLCVHSRCNRHGQTILADCFYTPPLKILTIPDSYHKVWPQSLHIMQMSASPGLFNGDQIDIRLHLEKGSRLQLSTQAFTRVQTMPLTGAAQQHLSITMQPQTRLYYVPHPLVLHQQASLRQTTHIHLDDESVLILGEIIACGRSLNRERWQLNSLSATLAIDYKQQTIITDNIQWQPQQQALDVLGQMEHFSHQASLHYVHTGSQPQTILQRTNQLYEFLQQHWPSTTAYLWGVSQSNPYGLCLRALAESAEPLQQLLQQSAQWLAQHIDTDH